jgi:ribA/ribD-fused uncharacterized protein
MHDDDDGQMDTVVEQPGKQLVVPTPEDEGSPGSRRGKRGEGFFWVGHRTRGYMTNEYVSLFDVDGMRFASVSWYMWYMRAKVWSPHTDLAVLIREAGDVEKAKQLSRRCTSGSRAAQAAWKAARLKVMAKAVLRKFESSEELGQKLVDTGAERLVFASQFDGFHGIGMTMKQGRDRRDEWGKNYLGQMLMLVRTRIGERHER